MWNKTGKTCNGRDSVERRREKNGKTEIGKSKAGKKWNERRSCERGQEDME